MNIKHLLIGFFSSGKLNGYGKKITRVGKLIHEGIFKDDNLISDPPYDEDNE